MVAADLATPGQRIKFLRKTLGLTQKGLAAKVHTVQPAISQWEHDKWVPTRPTQFLLADALNTTRTFLFGEDERGAA